MTLSMSHLTALGYQWGSGCPMKVGDPTPWGPAQVVTPVRRGDVAIVRVHTASHGGYYVPDELLHRIPEAHQRYGFQWSGSRNWYEEDCAWAYVALAIPELFTEKALDAARLTQAYIKNCD